jgi:hypothetical protein
MRIACFYTSLHPACRNALPPDTELVWTGDGDDHYWLEIANRWDGSDDLLIIEHDIEIHDQVVSQMLACGSSWCTFPYEYGPRWPAAPLITGALGCTRFSADLQRQFPAEVIAASVSAADGLPPVPFWHSCDLYIRRALTRAGMKECRHLPLVTHHRGRPHGEAGLAVVEDPRIGRPVVEDGHRGRPVVEDGRVVEGGAGHQHGSD